jgi:predicted ribosome quality control (RQC) complex YloA/Tae2 family protein
MFLESADTYTIQVGRNAKENTLLCNTHHDKECLWFHVWNHPSPHGFLITDTPTEELIQKTAQLVKQFSKFKTFAKITIEYIPIKYVHTTNIDGTVTLSKSSKKIIV